MKLTNHAIEKGLIEKSSKTIVMICLMFALAAALVGISSTKACGDSIFDDASISKHWDPSHPGHMHQCPTCNGQFNKPGDSGPNSPGYRRCPRCNPGEPLVTDSGPTPGPHPGPTPGPCPTPGRLTTADLINMWNDASTYEKADRMISDNVKYVTDLTCDNLMRLWDKCRKYDSADATMFNAVVTHDFSSRDLLRIWDRAHTYAHADEILVEGVIRMIDVNFDSISRLWDKAHTYANADAIILKIMRRTATNDLLRLKAKCRFRSTEEAIDREISMRGGSPYGRMVTNATRSIKADAALESLAKAEKVFPVTMEEIDSLNFEKIGPFVENLKAKKIRRTENLQVVMKALVNKLKFASLEGNVEASQMLESLGATN
jgi:hypothetical protein